MKLIFSLPINLSAWGLLIFTNSCWRNCKRFCFEVSVISRLIRSKSTEDGWCFVSKGMGGITSVLRANLTVTFLLQKTTDGIRWLCIAVLGGENLNRYIYILRCIWHKFELKLCIRGDDSHLSHVMQYFWLQCTKELILTKKCSVYRHENIVFWKMELLKYIWSLQQI